MSIAPLQFTVRVKTPPAKSFDIFTRNTGKWWPKGKTIGKTPHEDIVIEPRVDGRFFERAPDGTECQWGKVLAWDPPGRVLIAWQLNSKFEYDPSFFTEVEVTFAPAEGGGTVVTLEHRELQRFGADAEKTAASLGGGWPARLGDFVAFADASETAGEETPA